MVTMAHNENKQEDLKTTKPFLRVLSGETAKTPPIWLMRQAGRYLPEYRELRTKAGGFLDLVYNPEWAAEVTLQPLRRFRMDAAILFSDILVIPQALGQDVKFEAGEGPRLDALAGPDDLNRLMPDQIDQTLSPIYDTIKIIRQGFAQEGFDQTALIGFAGAPWTVICYMVEGQATRDFIRAKQWAAADPKSFGTLVDIVTKATIHYLRRQADAGAEALQIFDSWAGVLDEDEFRRWSMGPVKIIAAALKETHPDIPLIGFPRGAGLLYEDYAQKTGVHAVSIDYQLPVSWAAKTLQPYCPVQGNLDPVRLLAGGTALEKGVEKIMETLSGRPFIFNLGHGIHKDTPPDHVKKLVQLVRGYGT